MNLEKVVYVILNLRETLPSVGIFCKTGPLYMIMDSFSTLLETLL